MIITKGHISRPNINDFPKPEIVRGIIVDVTVRNFDGVTLCKVKDDYGNFYEDVQIIVNSLSSTDTKIKLSVRKGDDVVLLKTSISDPVYIIGSIYNDPDSKITDTIQASGRNQDRITTSASDYRIDNGGNTLNLTDGYGFIFDTNNGFRFQMPTDGIFRISSGGLGDDNPTSNAELSDFLCNKAEGYLSQMNDKLKQMEEIHNKIQLLFSDMQIAFTALQTFASTQTGVSTGPLLLLQPGFSALLAAMATTVTNVTSGNTELSTELSNYANLPLKTKSDAIVQSINCGNGKVVLPKDN